MGHGWTCGAIRTDAPGAHLQRKAGCPDAIGFVGGFSVDVRRPGAMRKTALFSLSVFRTASRMDSLPAARAMGARRAFMRISPRVGPLREMSAREDDDRVEGKDLLEMTRVDYATLVNTIKRFDDMYYGDNPSPEVSDEYYDNLLERLNRIEEARPEWILPDSPTQKPGYARPSKNFAPVLHTRPMLSLQKTYSNKELDAFVERVTKEVDSPFCVELKIDGVALRLSYKNGELEQATTRGDGTVGDDVTRNAREVQGIPLKLPEGWTDVEVTGEVCILTEDFKYLKRQSEQFSRLANVRNAAAGGLKLLDSRAVRSRRLTFIAYDLAPAAKNIPEDFPKTQSQCLRKLKLMGFMVSSQWRTCRTSKEILEFANEMARRRDKLPMEVDGVVVKVDNNEARETMGATRRSPRGAVAHKFSGLQAATTVSDIVFQVSRNGFLTPVAHLQPVSIGGVTISRATLHNFGFVESMDIRNGDIAIIERGGDVIPKIIKVDHKCRMPNQQPLEAPSQCPACNGKVVREGKFLRCTNMFCSGQQLERIVFFASKNGMNMDSIGEKTIKKLYDMGKIRKPSDLLALTKDDLIEMGNTRDKMASKILNNIREAAAKRSFAQVIHSMGIAHCGVSCAEMLASKAGSLDRLLQLTSDELMQMPGIGKNTAWAIAEALAEEPMVKELCRLEQLGVVALRKRSDGLSTSAHSEPGAETISNEPATSSGDEGENSQSTASKLSRKSFVFTGTLENLSRDEAGKMVAAKGGVVRRQISKAINYVVVGDSPGKKLDEAKKLGLKILSLEEFTALMHDS